VTHPQIKRLALSTVPIIRARRPQPESVSSACDILIRQGNRVFDAYLRPDFGWEVVQSLQAYGLRKPVFFEGKLKWIFRAWRMTARPDRDDRWTGAIRWAYNLYSNPELEGTRATLEGAMVIKDSTLASVSRMTGLSADAVECYDTLFWNVLDRRQDLAYLQSMIYPKGRVEEMVKGFFHTHNLGKILRRIGYNNNYEDLAYGGGFRFSPVDTISIVDAKEQNERLTLGIGAYMLRNFGMQSDHHISVCSSRQLLQAAKLGGIEENAAGVDRSFGEYAHDLFSEDRAALESSYQEAKRRQHSIVDVTAESM